MAVAIGVDVGKANLDVSVSEGPVVRFDNTKPGITKLLKYLGSHNATLVVCEATGGYERARVNRLREAEVAVHVAHPTRVRAFARRAGTRPRPTPGTPRCCPATDRSSRRLRYLGMSSIPNEKNYGTF